MKNQKCKHCEGPKTENRCEEGCRGMSIVIDEMRFAKHEVSVLPLGAAKELLSFIESEENFLRVAKWHSEKLFTHAQSKVDSL